jgi:hypothetical protein
MLSEWCRFVVDVLDHEVVSFDGKIESILYGQHDISMLRSVRLLVVLDREEVVLTFVIAVLKKTYLSQREEKESE